MVATYPLNPPSPLEVALRKIADGVPLTREERMLVDQRLMALEVLHVLDKIANGVEITEEEAALARAHQLALTADDLHGDSGVAWEDERAYLLGERVDDPYVRPTCAD